LDGTPIKKISINTKILYLSDFRKTGNGFD
jgi:hypothetical protein